MSFNELPKVKPLPSIPTQSNQSVSKEMPPQTQKSDSIKNEPLGSKSGVTTNLTSISRETITASDNSAVINQPKTSLVRQLVSAVRQYIKGKLSRSPKQDIETSWPYKAGAKPEDRLLKDQTGVQAASLDNNLNLENTKVQNSNVEALSQASESKSKPVDTLNRAKVQLKALERNQQNPALRPLPLSPNFPKEMEPLKALIADLEKSIRSEA
jgi:hypothetical protein